MNYVVVNSDYSQTEHTATLEKLVAEFPNSGLRKSNTTSENNGSVNCVRNAENVVVAVEETAHETGDYVA